MHFWAGFEEMSPMESSKYFPWLNQSFAMADALVERYAFDFRLRALDALQLAVALELRNQQLVDHFVAADKILCEVATLEAFSVINPENF